MEVVWGKQDKAVVRLHRKWPASLAKSITEGLMKKYSITKNMLIKYTVAEGINERCVVP